MPAPARMISTVPAATPAAADTLEPWRKSTIGRWAWPFSARPAFHQPSVLVDVSCAAPEALARCQPRQQALAPSPVVAVLSQVSGQYFR